MSWFQEKHSNKIKWLNYGWLSLILALNFAASPTIKYVYLGYLGFVFLTIFLFDFSKSVQVFVGFSFLEGQGRIVWEYGAFFRIVFDLLLVLVIARSMVKNVSDKKFIDIIPKHMIVLISLHFFWYFIEIFNIDLINILAPIAAMKMYVVPFFVFLMLNQNKDVFKDENLNPIINLIIFLLIAECMLSMWQISNLEKHMLAISSYYSKSMKDGIFTASKFRPFGTTHIPGGISALIFLTSGILFLKRKMSKKYLVFAASVLLFCFLTLLLCQVRSGMLKFGLVISGSFVALIINSKNRIAISIRLIFGSIILFPLIALIFGSTIQDYLGKIENLESSLERWEGMADFEHLSSQRVTPFFALGIVADRLQKFPFGVGPGMTGAASSLSSEQIKNDPIFKDETFWGFDNFYLSMVIEYGYGCIFYLLYIFSIPLLMFKHIKKLFFQGDYINSRIIMVCLINVMVILMGNWGANGLPYNPESFYFLFWSAIGFNTYKIAQEKS